MTPVPDEPLERLAALVRRESGIEVPEARLAALRSAVKRTGAADAQELLREIAQPGRAGRTALDRLLDEVTVQETSFHRDVGQLAEIDWSALYASAVGAGGSAVRVWSVGCATGEEAYTLAMLAADAFAAAAPPVTVLGTDISGSAVERAREGRYRLRRAGAVPPAQRDRFLEPDGDWVVVRPNLGRLVRFARHNLVADAAPPPGEEPFDLVVCRNVLIYFDPPTAERVAGSLRGALRGGGRLLLGAADQLGRSNRSPAAADGQVPPAVTPSERLARAVAAADAGLADEALAEVDLLLAADPLNAGGHFLRGLVELPRDARAAVDSLGRALLIDPRFGLAAFQLGRAYDSLGEDDAAREAYERALGALDPEDVRYDELLGQVDLGDVAAAIRVRMEGLR